VPSIAVGTIAAKRSLPYARVLARSFLDHHPGIPFFVLLADEVDGRFEPGKEPFELLLLEDVSIPNLPRFRFGHGEQELSYASTPYLLEALLERGFSGALFFKQESLVVGDQGPVLDGLRAHSILLTPHLLDPLSGPDRAARELNILQSGVFNAGLVGVRDTPSGRDFLRWWQDRVYAHCRHAVADGLHYEQRWLDLAPAFFEDVCVLRDPGANVGHWNLPDRAAEEPRLFRFSGFDPAQPGRVTRYSARVSMAELGATADRFAGYAEALYAAGWSEAQRWPYAYGSFANGVAIPAVARQLYLQLGDAVERFGDPFRTSGPDSYFRWLNEQVNRSSVTRLWAHVHGGRPDLQVAFPDLLDGDGDAFMAWAAERGVHEHQIPTAFIGR
jgi:hypothetical protein